MKENALNWFEIFVEDFDRAKRFYETILNTQLQDTNFQGGDMAIFPYDSTNGIGGSLSKMEGRAPGTGGTIVYLNVEGDLDGVLERIPAAGGKVLEGRLDIAPHGFIGVFADTEGNVVGLHSMS